MIAGLVRDNLTLRICLQYPMDVWAVKAVFAVPVVVAGLLGNGALLTSLVQHPRLCSPTGACVASLAVADFAFLATLPLLLLSRCRQRRHSQVEKYLTTTIRMMIKID